MCVLVCSSCVMFAYTCSVYVNKFCTKIFIWTVTCSVGKHCTTDI